MPRSIAAAGMRSYLSRVPRKAADPAHRDAADVRGRLKAAGLRNTAPRVAVLRHLQRAAGPTSHAEIVQELSPLGFDRATLYRNLVDLVDAGLVSRTDLGDHLWRF